MLTNLIIWSIIFFHLLGVGRLVIHLFADKESQLKVSVPILLFIGLFTAMGILSITHFFIPVSIISFSLLSFLACIGYFLSVKTMHLELGLSSITQRLFLFGVGVLILFQSSQTPTWVDTRLYHNQVVQWYSHYPIVKGLANLFFAYGYNSFFHLYASQYTFGFLPVLYSQSAAVSFLFLLFAYYIIQSISEKNSSPIVLLLICLVVFRDRISSTTPDGLIYILIAVGVLEFVKSSKQRESHVFLILSFFMIPMVKLSGVVYALLIIPYVLQRHQHKLNFLFVIGVVMGCVWVARNLVLSGYPLMPLSVGSFPFKHTIPYDILKQGVLEIKYFQRLPLDNWRDAIGVPFPYWVPKWYSLHERIDKSLMLLTPTCLLFLVLCVRRFSAQQKIAFGMVILAVLFWVFLSPGMRFVYMYIALLLMWVYQIFEKYVYHKLPVFKLSVGVVMLLLCYFLLQKASFNQLLRPAEIAKATIAKKRTKEGLLYTYPIEGRCRGASIPCGYLYPYKEIHSFTHKPEDGFYSVFFGYEYVK